MAPPRLDRLIPNLSRARSRIDARKGGHRQDLGEDSSRQAITQFHQKMARETSKLSISDAENPVPSAKAPRIIGQFSGHWTKNG
jgi:hypothetical protein